ncbi:MAG: CHASE4 domain-containing protein [Methanobacteriota archaeon]
MKLRKKISLVLASTLAMFIVALVVVSNTIVSDGFSELERLDVEENAQRVINAVGRETERINRTCVDWASWDDTYDFIQDGNGTYLASNLPDETFAIINVNVIVYADTHDDIVFAKAVDLDGAQGTPLPDGLVSLVESGEISTGTGNLTGGACGIVLLPDGALLISTQPILTSLEQGPARGTLLMGRFIDESLVAQFADVTQMDVSFSLFEDPALDGDLLEARSALSAESGFHIIPLNGSAIAGYFLMEDVHGEPALLCKILLERGIFKQGQASSAYLMAALVTLAATIIVVTALAIERFVISRMLKLSMNVGGIGPLGNSSKRLAIEGDDEITSLTRAINDMLDKLDRSMNALSATKDEMERQARQAKEICRAMVENIGPERASGLLYGSGWKMAMKWSRPPDGASQLSRLKFVEVALARQAPADGDKVVVMDFDVKEMNARFMMVPPNGEAAEIGTNPLESYRTGFCAGIVSLAFGQQVGLKTKFVDHKGKSALEFTTRILEPYERSAYRLG